MKLSLERCTSYYRPRQFNNDCKGRRAGGSLSAQMVLRNLHYKSRQKRTKTGHNYSVLIFERCVNLRTYRKSYMLRRMVMWPISPRDRMTS